VALYARPYDPFDGHPIKNTLILDALVAHPALLPIPMDPQTARATWGAILTEPGHIVFEVWRDTEIVGVVWLTRILPRVDAVLQFYFFDRDLVGKRKLLQNFVRFCFRDLGFRRLTMEVPEGARIERFARKVLSFKLEGESRPRNPELPKALSDSFVARQGSRREGVRFDGQTWTDVVVLRLMAEVWPLDA
jgi:hypothetical protein